MNGIGEGKNTKNLDLNNYIDLRKSSVRFLFRVRLAPFLISPFLVNKKYVQRTLLELIEYLSKNKQIRTSFTSFQ